jgi:DNA-binding response OmpR family regulator
MAGSLPVYMTGMGTNCTLLCIHRDPSQLSLLEQGGYKLVTATSGADGLRLFMSRPVDAIVLDYQLGLLDGGIVATEIKKVKPQLPIVMLAEDVELSDETLKSVDALVAKSDGPHLLLATVHFVLNVKPAQRRKGKLRVRPPHLRLHGRSRAGVGYRRANTSQLAIDEEDTPFSPKVWRSIRNGKVRF